MAVSSVQKYFNLALSLTVGNKSGTDLSFILPEDLRKYSDLKIKQIKTQSVSVPYHDTIVAEVDRVGGDDDAIFVLSSHPIKITAVNGQDLTAASGNDILTSFFVVARDRAGGYVAALTPTLRFENDLTSPNFSSTGAPGATAEVLVVQVTFE